MTVIDILEFSVELQQEIDKDSAKYIRHSRRASSASVTPPSPSSRAPSPKSMSIPAKISASYAEIHELAAEKCALAERLIDIITRTRTRLDYDITKVRTLQGDPPEVIAASMAAASKPLTVLPSLSTDGLGAPGRNPALAISESLRNALAIPPVVESRPAVAPQTATAASPSPSASHATKSTSNCFPFLSSCFYEVFSPQNAVSRRQPLSKSPQLLRPRNTARFLLPQQPPHLTCSKSRGCRAKFSSLLKKVIRT